MSGPSKSMTVDKEMEGLLAVHEWLDDEVEDRINFLASEMRAAYESVTIIKANAHTEAEVHEAQKFYDATLDRLAIAMEQVYVARKQTKQVEGTWSDLDEARETQRAEQ